MMTDKDSRPEGENTTPQPENESYKPYTREGGYNRYNRSNDQSGYNRRPYVNNREGNDRPSYNRDGGDRPYRSSYNPRYNNSNEDRPQRNNYGYGNNRPQQRPYGNRPNYGNNEGGERQYTPRYNNNYNNNGGYNRDGGERQYRPSYNPRYNNNNNGEGGDQQPQQRPYRPRFTPGGDQQQQQRPYRPRFTPGGDQQQQQRPYRPRFTPGGDRQQQRPYRPRTNDYNPNAKYSMKKQIEYKDILTDPNEPIRLNKFLANAGVCSRREADEFITAGVVSVNGEVVTELGTKIKRTDEVKFHDQPVSIEHKVYILLNKPKDCVTTSDDPQERNTVMDCVKGACKERIYPVGRLDRNTTGVLLLTNDGDLASKLTHPKYLKKKIYHVYCDKNVTKADLDKMVEGITLDDGEIHADAVSYASDTDKSQVGIEIHSGKNRIVRRIFEALGYRVVKLDRVYFAGLTKKGLRRGDWRYLTEQEVNYLRMGSFE